MVVVVVGLAVVSWMMAGFVPVQRGSEFLCTDQKDIPISER